MQDKSFSKMMYEGAKKQNKAFILSVTIMIVFMYNAMNTYYNKAIYDVADGTVTKEYYDFYNNFVSITEPIEYKIKTNIFLILGLVTLVIIISTTIYMKEKSEAVACIIYSGGTLKDVLNFLIYATLKSFFNASILGIVIGIIISPVYNWILYAIIGSKSNLFTFNIEGFLNIVMFLGLIIIAVIIINFGSIYRKDVMDLINFKSEKSIVDKRIIKIPFWIYWMLYLTPIMYAITLPREKGAEGIVYLLSWGSIFVLYWVVRYGIDGFFSNLKKMDFMYKKNKIIYIGNAMKTIKQSTGYIGLYMAGFIYTLDIVAQLIEFKGIKENLAICIGGVSLSIALGIGYKLYVEFSDIEERGLQLRTLGYSDKEVISCIKSEVVTIFMFTIMLPLINLIGNLAVYMSTGIFSLDYGIAMILVLFIPPNVTGVACSILCTKKIKNKLNKISIKPKEIEGVLLRTE